MDWSREVVVADHAQPVVLVFVSENEYGWWGATMRKLTQEQKRTSGQRQRLVGLLKERYAGAWQQLRADFDAENADGGAESVVSEVGRRPCVGQFQDGLMLVGGL